MKLRKYYMIDTLKINNVPTLRLRGTTNVQSDNVAFMARALGCQLMRHLPPSLKEEPATVICQ